jgi:hypothetical protein
MVRGRARYNNPLTIAEKIHKDEPELPNVFSDAFKQSLTSFFPGEDLVEANDFVNEIVGEARSAQSDLDEINLRLKKADLLAEIIDLLDSLNETRNKLRRLSPDLDRLIDMDPDPATAADALDSIAAAAEEAQKRIKSLPKAKPKTPNAAPTVSELRRELAMETAIRVLRVAKCHGMRISASGRTDAPETFSPPSRLMKQIGDTIGLRYEVSTWRNIVGAAMKRAGDL